MRSCKDVFRESVNWAQYWVLFRTILKPQGDRFERVDVKRVGVPALDFGADEELVPVVCEGDDGHGGEEEARLGDVFADLGAACVAGGAEWGEAALCLFGSTG